MITYIFFYWFDGERFCETSVLLASTTTLADVRRWSDECKRKSEVCYHVVESE